MARYYFNVKRGDTIDFDEEGLALPDVTAAAREAELAARQLLAEAIKARQPNLPEAMVVTDEAGKEVYSFPFVAVLLKTLKW
jgi:hypothetical protein